MTATFERDLDSPSATSSSTFPGRPVLLGAAALGASLLAALNAVLPVGAVPAPGVPQTYMPMTPPPSLQLPPGLALPAELLPSGPIAVPATVLRDLIVWPLAGFAVALAITTLLAVRFAARFGRRALPWSLLALAATTAAGTIDGGDTWTFFARTGQGIAAAVVLVAAIAALFNAVDAFFAVTALFGWVVTAAVGVAVGPAVAAVAMGHWGWTLHTLLWVQVPVGVGLAALAWLAAPSAWTPVARAVIGGPALMVTLLVGVAVTLTVVHPSAHIAPLAVLIGLLALPVAAIAMPAVARRKAQQHS